MSTQQLLTSPQPEATSNSKTIRIKHISVSALYRAVELLGGTPTRNTGGHNYRVYRFPNNKQVHLPPIKGGTGKPIGRGGLQTILNQFLDAGIPHPVLEQTLDFVGATWWSKPTPNKPLQDHLTTKPKITSTNQWTEMNTLLESTQPKPTTPEEDQQLQPEPEPVMRTLREAATLKLPRKKDETAIKFTLQQLRSRFENGDEKYQQLILDQHVDTRINGDAFKFLLNDTASEIIAQDALHIYTNKINEVPLPPAPKGHQWSNLTLREVVQLDLSNEAAQRHTQKLVYRFSRKLPSREQPFSRLMKEQHVIRRSGGTGKPMEYLFTEHAASVLAREAKKVYENVYKPQERDTHDVKQDNTSTPATDQSWCDLSLEDVIKLDLPANTPAKFLNNIKGRLINSYRRKTPPMSELIRGNHVSREEDLYRVTEHGASVIAKYARAAFNRENPVPRPSPTTALMAPTPSSNAPVERPLSEVIKLNLPPGYSKRVIPPLATRISTAIARKATPYADLLDNGELTRTYNKQRRHQVYTMTPNAASVIAKAAHHLYEKHYAPQEPTAKHAPAPESTNAPPTVKPEPTSIQATHTEKAPLNAQNTAPGASGEENTLTSTTTEPIGPAVPHDAATAIATLITRHKLDINLSQLLINLAIATRDTPTSAEAVNPGSMSISDAVTELTQRYGTPVPLSEPDHRFDIQQFIINLEVSTRPDTPAPVTTIDEAE